MSATAPLPDQTDRPSWFRRLRFTPMSDLVHGRVTGRLGLVYLLFEARLPAPLTHLVLLVVRRTRLWRSEKREVARELIAHFQDGLEAGASPAELAGSFGDATQAARLIRRAKKRNRPWPWRAARTALRGTVLLVGVILLLYAVQTARYYAGAPTIQVDFRPRFNAEAESVPEADRAWPLYRAALLGMPPLPTIGSAPEWKGYSREPEPGEPGWEVMEAYLQRQHERLAVVRQAAAKPALGRPANFSVDDKDRALWPDIAAVDDDFRTHNLFEVVLPHLNSLRLLANTLSADAQRAAAAGDGAMAVADIEATLGIARHVREQPFMINDLVSLACFNRAVADATFVLDRFPQCLHDDQLIRLAHLTGAMSDAQLQVRLEGEEWGFQDVLQRAYTDNGSGDGRLTPAGFKLLEDCVSIPGTVRDSSPWMPLIAPAGSAFILSRREMQLEHQRLLGLLRAEAATPLWQRGPSQADEVIEGWAASNVEKIRHLPLVLLMPALSHASINAQMAMQHRDALLLVIAMELYHRQHGAWPESQHVLVPTLLPAEAVDRFDGRPLRFVIRDGRPVAYSVGVDRDDDGGNWPLTARGTRAQTMEVSRWRPAQEAQERLRLTMPNVDGAAAPNPCDGDWILFPPYHDPYPLIPPPNPDGS